MSGQPSPKRRGLLASFYRMILRCYPAQVFERTAQDMTEVFLDLHAEELTKSGRVGAGVFTFRAFSEVPFKAAMAHIELRFGSGHSVSIPNTKKMPFESTLQDVRYAVRSLWKRPLYLSVAVLTLGMGIGAATAMFSVIDGVLLKQLPYREPGRLVTAWIGYPEWGQFVNYRYDQYRLWRENNTLFQDVAIYLANSWGQGTVTGAGQPETVSTGTATASLLPVLGVDPVLGRWFVPDEIGTEPGGAAPVAVVSFELWVRMFGADPNVLGHVFELDGISRTIVGVLPNGFRIRWLTGSPLGTREVAGKEVWLPLGQSYDCLTCGSSMYQAVGRLLPGASLDQAASEALTIIEGTATGDGITTRMVPRDEDEIRGLGSPLVLLLAATGVLLVIACGNIATLSLGEVQARRQEFATRSALGAGKTRIVRQLLTESLILGLLGSLVGVLAAIAGTKGLLAMAPPIPRLDQVGVNGLALAFAVTLGTLSGILFGTIPSVLAARASIAGALRASGRSSTTGAGRYQKAVVALEIALTAVLLVTGGLLTRSLSSLLDVDPGFDPENLATLHVSLPERRYPDPESRADFVTEVLHELERIPGALAFTAGNNLPFPGTISGWAVRDEAADPTLPRLSGALFHVTPGFHETMGIRLVDGRTFAESDGPDAPDVGIVSETLANRLWPNGNVVGRRLAYPWTTVTIVGVVADVRRKGLGAPPELDFYVPFSQLTRAAVSFAVRTSSDPALAIPQMRDAIWSVDSELAIIRSGTMEALLSSSASDERFRTLLMGAFGILASALAAVGVFGVTARTVAQRTREMGIRMALGARESGVVTAILGDSLIAGLLGIAVGIVGALWASRLTSGFLFNIEPTDPTTYAVVVSLLLTLCLLASYLPARRIARVDPVDVLKAE